MRQLLNEVRQRKAIAIAVAIGFLLGAILFSLTLYERNRVAQEETILATERFIVLDNELNNLVYTNVNLLQGFLAYIQTNDQLTDENIYRFMEVLMSSQEVMIKNIGILKDTTIIWNYPYEENKASIGVDLASIDSQREAVLRVKDQATTIFQGPVDLVQGGKAFIIRQPIIDNEGAYWGQVSIVLKYEAFVDSIQAIEEQLGIRVVILSEEELVYGDSSTLERRLHWFDFDDDVFVWDVGLELLDQNNDMLYRMLLFSFFGLSALFIFSIATYITVRASEKVKHESIHDHLTGLRNRYTLEETIEQIFAASNRSGNKAGILLVDLNRFKEINDVYGHLTGDIVLREVANKLKHASRADEILFRVGGDEFLLVAPVVDGFNGLKTIKARFKDHLAFTIEVKGNQIEVSASIGCALYKDDGDNYDILYHVADQRMYAEKNGLEEPL